MTPTVLRTVPRVFDPSRYLHRCEPFGIIRKWFSYAQISTTVSIRDYILNSPKITSKKPMDDDTHFHAEIDSPDVPYLLFLESQLFLNRALSNFCAQLELHRVRCHSWASVTTYYSSFFAVSGLLRLQGKARIATHNERGLPRGFFLSISSTSSPCCVVFPNWRNHHKQTCSDFYYSYKNYDHFTDSFRDLLSLEESDLLEEVSRRNDYNYDLRTGYRELDTPDYDRPDLRRVSVEKIRSLPLLVTDPDPELAYMARACSRIILLAHISWQIAKDSPVLKLVFLKSMEHRQRIIEGIHQGRSEIVKCLGRFSRGRMRLS